MIALCVGILLEEVLDLSFDITYDDVDDDDGPCLLTIIVNIPFVCFLSTFVACNVFCVHFFAFRYVQNVKNSF